MRWLVERKQDVFDDVGAETMKVLSSGALEFTTQSRLEVLYAAGQWITVVPDVED
jgi:hypothetical protein